MVKSGESEREAAARSDELFKDGDIVAAGGKNHSEIRIKQKKIVGARGIYLARARVSDLIQLRAYVRHSDRVSGLRSGRRFFICKHDMDRLAKFFHVFRRNEFLATDCKHFYFKHTRLYHRIPFANYRSAIIEFVYQ